MDRIHMVRRNLKASQDWQKSYADPRRREICYNVGDKVFLKVSFWKGVAHFGKKGKLSPRYIGAYEILEQVGLVAYRLALPMELAQIYDVFHVSMLRRYQSNPSHVITGQPIEVKANLSYIEKPVQVLDTKIKQLRNQKISMVKVG